MQPPAVEQAARGRASSWALRGLFGIALLLFLREAKPLLVPVAMAVVLTFVLSPWVRMLRRRGIPEALGAAILVLGLLGSTVPIVASLATPASLWLERAPSTVTQLLEQFDRLRSLVPGFGPPARPAPRSAGRAAAPPADPVKDRLASEGVALTGALLGRTLLSMASFGATMILLYVLLASEHWMLSRFMETLPKRRTRALVLGGLRIAQRDIGRYLAALTVVNLAVAAATGLTSAVLGLPNPLLWGVLAGVLNFIPYIGPLMVAVLLLGAGVLSFADLPSMLSPMFAYLLIHMLDSMLFNPWLVGRRLMLSTLSVFLSVMFWGWLWGISGALIAVPVLIGLRTVCKRVPGLRLLGIYLQGYSPSCGKSPAMSFLRTGRRSAVYR